MKKGFTLIELLAVIVILAIIALIATPIILGIIEDARTEAKVRSGEIYITAVEQAIIREKMNGSISFNPSSCTITNSVITCEGMDEPLKVDIDGILPTSGTITFNDGKVDSYTLVIDGKEIVNGVIQEPTLFETDSWETIIKNVQEGNVSRYNVGDTKEIVLQSEDTNIAGTYKVRVANTSTPTECGTTGFSQTACGFVIEFVDIINTQSMNSSDTNVGGWEKSTMRTYVNNNIYNSLPSEIKNAIIETTVVSGHGETDSSNFTTTDKLYLLSTKEVWENGKIAIEADTASTKTRQLDYYKKMLVTTDNYSGAIKTYNGTDKIWWLRNANVNYTGAFYVVTSVGFPLYQSPTFNNGVAPAFRIGTNSTSTNKFCSLESGTSKTIGAKYTCTLDQDRTFYVLGENEEDSNKINLIMDRNYIDDTVPKSMKWCANGSDNSCNHDNLDPYIEHIQGVFGDSVTVSLPTAQQIATAGEDTGWTTGSYTKKTLPLWLYDNLLSESDDSLPYGYWTSTTYSDDSNDCAWIENWYGYLCNCTVTYDFIYGIRPVIIVSKTNME